MTTQTTSRVVVTHHYAASPERVFDAFLDAQIAPRFLFATPTGEMIVAEIEPRVGGRFTFTERRPDMGEIRHVGEYLEIDRPRRLVFTFGVPQFDPNMTRVEIDIVAKGSGCELTLTHHGVPPEWQAQTTQGWTMLLGS